MEKDKPADAGLSLVIKGARERYGFDSVMKEILGSASPEERAQVPGMLLAVQRDLSGVEKPRRLDEADAAGFRAFLAEQPWSEASGLSPSEFISTACKGWLERGLALVDLRSVQPDLATRYSLEVSRDPSRRVPGLYVKPHAAEKGTPSRIEIREVKYAADLSEDELAERRRSEREKKARFREKKRRGPAL